MDREQAIERLSDYLEGELSAQERAELEALIAEDAELRTELEALRSTLAVLHSLPEAEPPADFVRGVQRKLRHKSTSLFNLSFGLDKKIPFEAVSILLLGILLALYLILVALPDDQLAPDEPARQPEVTTRDAGAHLVSPDGAPQGGRRRGGRTGPEKPTRP